MAYQGDWYGFAPYVSVAQRRKNAEREVAKLKKKGRTITPVAIEGRTIARTFWAKAWCDNLESYSDYENRLPRGRTYVRNGSVVDLQVAPGKVTALVSGSSLYRIEIRIAALDKARWRSIVKACSGRIGSLVELLRGKLSQPVMEVVARRGEGLFPQPREIEFDCSCPDAAYMCKHVAAALYGVGARFDERPELLFALRKTDHLELVAGVGDAAALAQSSQGKGKKTIAESQLASVFGIELDAAPTDEPAAKPKQKEEKAKPRRIGKAVKRDAPSARKRSTTAPAAIAAYRARKKG